MAKKITSKEINVENMSTTFYDETEAIHVLKETGWLEKHDKDVYYSGYDKGLDDVWELAKSLVFNDQNGGLPYKVMLEIYNTRAVSEIFNKYSVKEALQKLKEYKAKHEINIGDVVVNKQLINQFPCIVVNISEDGLVDVISDKTPLTWSIKDVEKVGYNFDEIKTALDKLKEIKEKYEQDNKMS